MTAVFYRSPDLPWTAAFAEEKRFRSLALFMVVAALIVSVILALLKIPELSRTEVERLPPRLAKLILEKEKLPPPPPPPPVEELQKVEPEKIVEEVKPQEPVPVTPEPDQKPNVEKAREKAARSGLLAMKDELASLRQSPLLNNVMGDGGKTLTRGTGSQGQESGDDSRSIITSAAKKGSGGISTSTLSRSTGGGGGTLAGRSTTVVESSIATAKAQESAARGNRKAARSTEQIQLVLDQNKGSIYAIYHRALRSNPALQGKVVLEITIDPSGQVAGCKVISSEIADDDMIRKLVARVKLFDFGAKEVEAVVFTWPIEFLPSG